MLKLKNTLFILSLIAVVSCKGYKTKSDRLIYYEDEFIGEMGDEVYENLSPKINSKIDAKYLDDVIYISKIVEANTCGKYDGNIELKGDTIYLIHELVSNEVCTSLSVYRLTFIIKNPANKKYKFVLKNAANS